MRYSHEPGFGCVAANLNVEQLEKENVHLRKQLEVAVEALEKIKLKRDINDPFYTAREFEEFAKEALEKLKCP